MGRREAENVCRSGTLDRSSHTSNYMTTDTGGHLPSIHSDEQLDRIAELAEGQDVWIGAHHIGNFGCTVAVTPYCCCVC